MLFRSVIDVALMLDLTQRARPKSTHIGELAIAKKWLNLAGLKQTLEVQETSGERFGGVAYRLGLLSMTQLASLLAEQAEDSGLVAEHLVKLGVINETEAATLLAAFRSDIDRSFVSENPAETASLSAV